MINLLISALALAGAVSASPFPQNFCPAGCDVIVTEHPNPDPHQTYFFQQMTKPHSCAGNPGCEISKSEVEGNVVSFGASISGAGWNQRPASRSRSTRSRVRCKPATATRTTPSASSGRTRQHPCTRSTTSLNRCCLPGPYAPRRHHLAERGWLERQNGGVTVSGGPQSWPFGNQHLGIVPDMDEIPPRTAGKV
ncbi:conserved hypothetical protein [Verticillium alfalfae VaMs.102]|uniref:Uncharacterized protein n=1 Tax=Verticillium alfalfae (strain VaMs.102 / ATCC MYA-4576 / FGSC 10136) TaxID=526221 RepID=C9STX6_VERA1|nr:conserved hypothetical protein [Verticillium alfalfae VaMs.102]EEY22287.1 conserved hypothetical protein [Verticillium alfalfae VaMs.102]